MANQYQGSIEHKARQFFGCSARAFLEQAAASGMTCTIAAQRLGVNRNTLHKWLRKFDIALPAGTTVSRAKTGLNPRFFDSTLNKFNALSRCWT